MAFSLILSLLSGALESEYLKPIDIRKILITEEHHKFDGFVP